MVTTLSPIVSKETPAKVYPDKETDFIHVEVRVDESPLYITIIGTQLFVG